MLGKKEERLSSGLGTSLAGKPSVPQHVEPAVWLRHIPGLTSGCQYCKLMKYVENRHAKRRVLIAAMADLSKPGPSRLQKGSA
jgi:hypothetical protein